MLGTLNCHSYLETKVNGLLVGDSIFATSKFSKTKFVQEIIKLGFVRCVW